jgi:uncharacterized protein (DUF983 family)
MSKPSVISSIFSLHCPRCRRGNLFETGSFSFDKPFLQYEHCPKCGQDYFPEPGFYWGAMFISYIGSAFFCLGFVMLLYWVIGWSKFLSFAMLILVAAVCFVWWFRFSRSAYFHLVTKYKPKITEAVDEGKLDITPPRSISSH